MGVSVHPEDIVPKIPCLAITLINPLAMEHAASYHWCKLDVHPEGTLHSCYCGLLWLNGSPDDLVEPTAEMILWRTGNESQIRGVSARLVGYAVSTT